MKSKKSKNNLLVFSDVQTPLYDRPYRGVLFIDYLYKNFDHIFIVSPNTDIKFKKSNNINYFHYKGFGEFKNFQYSLFTRIGNMFILMYNLFVFLKNNNVSMIRSGTTYLSFILSFIDKKTPYFADVCDFYFDLYEEFKMPFYKIIKYLIFNLEKIGINRPNLIFVDTDAQRKFMVDKMGLDYNKCIVSPNGVIIDLFPFSKYKDRDIMMQYGFTDDDIVLFYGGDASHMDGIENLIQFIHETNNNNIKLLILCKGKLDYINTLKKKIFDRNLINKIIIDGFKPYNELYKYLSVSDICVAPFKLTFTSNVVECGKIITYLLAGKKILSTYADGVNSLYGNIINYFSDGDYEDMKNKLNQLILNKNHDPSTIRKYGERFDFKKIIEHEYMVIKEYLKNPNQDFSKYDYKIF